MTPLFDWAILIFNVYYFHYRKRFKMSAQLKETIGTSLYNVVEDYSAGPEIKETLHE